MRYQEHPVELCTEAAEAKQTMSEDNHIVLNFTLHEMTQLLDTFGIASYLGRASHRLRFRTFVHLKMGDLENALGGVNLVALLWRQAQW